MEQTIYQDIIKILVEGMIENNIEYLKFTDENIEYLVLQINEYFFKLKLDNIKFDKVLFSLSLFKIYPNIFSHYNSTEKLFKIVFDSTEKNEIQTINNNIISFYKDRIYDLSHNLLENNEDMFVLRNSKKKVKLA